MQSLVEIGLLVLVYDDDNIRQRTKPTQAFSSDELNRGTGMSLGHSSKSIWV